MFSIPLHLLSNIEITKYFNYESCFDSVFSRDTLPQIKDVTNLGCKKGKEPTEFHYLLTEAKLCTLILLALNIFHKKD